MKNYLNSLEAAEFIVTGPVLEYPNTDFALLPKTFNSLTYPESAGGGLNLPSKLVRSVLPHINDKPRRVLDLGSGFSSTGLYLASLGHDVTAIDHPVPTTWQNKQARELELVDNYKAVASDAMQLEESDKYDLIMAEMLLHFFEPTDSRKMIAAMQLSTLVGGLNIISAYTDDNPDDEKLPECGRQNLFASRSLANSYRPKEWETVRDEEGYGDRFVHRPIVGDDMVLVPHVAELVVKKTIELESKQESSIFDSYFDDTANTSTYIL